MAYLALLWKARTIEKYRLKYEKEKINSINSKTELPNTLYQKWTVYRNESQKKLGQCFTKWCPEGSNIANSCTFLKGNSSFFLKILIGIVGGILLYLLCEIFVSQFSVWSVIGWGVGMAIILGVVFSNTVRCLVLLLIPGLFSRVGRYTLACYALVLILTGPATNTLKNLDTLSASLACGQEQIKTSVKEIKESKDSSLNLVKESMSGTVAKIESLAGSVKNVLVGIHRLTLSMAHVLQSSLSWLNSVENICNEKLGTPFDRCTRILEEGTDKCQKKFPKISSQWDWPLIIQTVCFSLKYDEKSCIVGDFAKGSIVATIKKKLSTYSGHIQELFSMEVHIRRSHSCCSNGSLPVNTAASGIVTEIRNRADTLLAWLSWTCALTGLFLMLIILRAKYYLHMFRTRSRFDNRYVTKELRELDLKRQRQGRETVLPLNTRERAKYVATASFRLLPSEKTYLTRSIVFMVITTLKLMIHMVADYSLYWVLNDVRFHGAVQHDSQPSNRTARVTVSGSGPLAATVRTLVEAISVPLTLPVTSTASCLPDPNPPDLQRYAQIGTLIFILWLLALFEPYGLRLRHVISGHYQPERAKARAVWLYYHIIRTRSCFLKCARRKLHRQFKYTSEAKLTFKNLLNRYIPCKWLRCLLGVGPAEPYCLLCYTKHCPEDLDRHLKRCETPSCPGAYCARCFMDMGQLCTICYSPEDYGDRSDVSLEKFNSDSGSDDSDNDNGDNIPLMRTLDDDKEENERQISRCQNESRMFSNPSKDKNQESTPLLYCDYSNKYYTNPATLTHYNANDNTLSRRKLDEVLTDINETEPKPVLKNITSSDEGSRLPIFFKDAEVTVNGVTFPKRKLGAIIQIMMLLTKKDEKNEKNRNNVTMKHKPFEYLVMEMFQPLEMIQRITQAMHMRTQSQHIFGNPQNNERNNKEVRFLFDNSEYANHLSTDTIDIQTDFDLMNTESIFKYTQDQQLNENLSNPSRSFWSTKRNVKRFVDIKKSITSSVKERSKDLKLNLNKHKFTTKRRRRKRKIYVSVGFSSTIDNHKLVSREPIDNINSKYTEVNNSLTVEKQIGYLPIDNVKLNDTKGSCSDLSARRHRHRSNQPKKRILKQDKSTESVIRRLAQYLQLGRKETQCSSRKNTQVLSSLGIEGSSSPSNSSVTSDDGCSADESIDTDMETNKNAEHKLKEAQVKCSETKKLGFWESLRLRRRCRYHSPLFFSSVLKHEPSFGNFFANYKRRKKTPSHNATNIESSHVSISPCENVKDNGCDYRVNVCLNDNNGIFKNITKYNVFKSTENIGMQTEQAGRRKYERLKPAATFIKHPKDQNRRAQRNTKLIEGKCNSEQREKEVLTDRDCIILYDGTQTADAETSTKRKFGQVLKTLSVVACNLKAKRKPRLVNFCEVPHPDSEDKIGRQPKEDTVHVCCRYPEFAQYFNSEARSHYESGDENHYHHGKNKESQEIVEIRTCIECGCESLPVENSCSHEWFVKPKQQVSVQVSVTGEDLETQMREESSSVIMKDDSCQFPLQTKSTESALQTKSTESPLEVASLYQISSANPNPDTASILLHDAEIQAVARPEESFCRCSCQREFTSGTQGSSLLMKHNKTQSSLTCLFHDKQETRSSEISFPWVVKSQPNKRCFKQKIKDKFKKEVPHNLPNNGEEDSKQYRTERSNGMQDSVSFPVMTTPQPHKRCFKQKFKDKFIKEVTQRLTFPTDGEEDNIEYTYEKPKQDEKPKPQKKEKEAIKTDRATATVMKTVADVSTITSDWWSPMLEKKLLSPRKSVWKMTEHKKRTQYEEPAHATSWELSSLYNNDSPVALLPASNFLPQTEKCYQQVYSVELSSSRGSQSRNKRPAEYENPSYKPYQRIHRGYKTKRLKEAKRKSSLIQSSSINLATPAKWQPVVPEEQTHALKHFKRANNISMLREKKSVIKKTMKLKAERDIMQYENSQTCEESNMWTASGYSSSF